MRLILGLVFLVGCAEGTFVSGPAPDLGPGGDASRPDAGEGGTAVPACDAPLESLSGRATYVPGSLAAAEPDALAIGTITCGQWVPQSGAMPSHADVVNGTVAVTSGFGATKVVPLVPVGSAPAGTGCAYTLRLAAPLSSGGAVCNVTLDYELVVP